MWLGGLGKFKVGDSLTVVCNSSSRASHVLFLMHMVQVDKTLIYIRNKKSPIFKDSVGNLESVGFIVQIDV